MNEHQYILQPYKGMKTRYRCPECNHKDKTFVRYISLETSEHLAPSVGRCNRETNCGYHYTPKQYFQDNNMPQRDITKPNIFIARARVRARTGSQIQVKEPSFIHTDLFKKSLKEYEINCFIQYLGTWFSSEITTGLISRYFIGSSKRWKGATVFWQIDISGNIRTGKIMLYSPNTGKRVKEPFNHIDWVHSALKQPEFELKQCLFGEHLINQNKFKPIAVVESEKTAVIASVYLPQFIWLAVGSLTNLNAEKCSALKGRTVTLFPDLNGFDKWSSKAKELSDLALFFVSDLLERKATEAERQQGLDLADYLTKFDYKAFNIPPRPHLSAVQPLLKLNPVEPKKPVYYSSKPKPQKTESWERDIKDLENYFAGIKMPTQPIKLHSSITIINIPLFIENHFATIKANDGKKSYLPYMNRLKEMKKILARSLSGKYKDC